MRTFISMVLLSSVALVGCTAGRNPGAADVLRPLKPVDFPNTSNSLFGAWSADSTTFDKGGVAQFVTLYFNKKGEIGFLLECVNNGETLSASGTTDVGVFAGRFSLNRAVQLRAAGTTKVEVCEMTFAEGDYGYEVRGDQLRLIPPKDDQTNTYSRVN